MKQYSADLRERLLGAIDAGLPVAEGARHLGVCPSTIRRWRVRQRTEGTAARPRPGRTLRIGSAQEAALQAQVAAAPDATLAQHCACGEAAQGVRVSVATMSRVLRRLGITVKKTS
jgi:transposase